MSKALLLAVLLLAQQAQFRATAYHLHGRTASGTKTALGTVAVDPHVIPLGTRLWVQGYGRCVARDTGRRIRGRRIDLWLSSRGACRRFGVRRLWVRWERKRHSGE